MKLFLDKVNEYIKFVSEGIILAGFPLSDGSFVRSTLQSCLIIPISIIQDAECPEDICCG